MEISYSESTGTPSNVSTELKQRISQYIRGYSEFRIGKTNDPEARARAYVAQGDDFDQMIVLYQTSSVKNGQVLESDLIDLYWESAGFQNERGGGAGAKGVGVQHVYLLVR